LPFYISDTSKKSKVNETTIILPRGKRKEVNNSESVYPSIKKTKTYSYNPVVENFSLEDSPNNFFGLSHPYVHSTSYQPRESIFPKTPTSDIPLNPIDTETQLTLLAGKILTPLSELIVHQPKKDECKDLLYQIRQDDINQRKVEEERKERIKQEEIKARKFELERQDRLKLEEFELDKRFKLEERMANIQARDKEREERILQDERLNNFRSFRLKLLFFAFLAICFSVSYILPALKEVLIEYFRGLYHKRN
jgi:hypothetical protein